ncbi:zinc finger MYM-type protein 1-like [Chenopodium quinoa]|uniref:zinc finger MYM-type protein 1-like n=1 Tax=Chenopodium quinoa TaxID=63459 RepID=UPI000B7899E4|nr:zinc finger MYM-type protein 1-like [Chenopodium quinoa]
MGDSSTSNESFEVEEEEEEEELAYDHEVENNYDGDAFVNGGFRAWNKPERFDKHVGGVNSAHNVAYEKFLLGQGLAFCGHLESEESYNRGNFLELLKWLRGKVEEVKNHTLENAPKNYVLTFPKIQKDIITCCAKETTRRIIEEVGDDYFAILADDSSDVSQKEQLALVLRFVDRKSGAVMERFLGIVHVGDTIASSLKNAIISLLMEHNSIPSMIRGQGYDGASNMKGEINVLKTLIMNGIPRAYYIHCFAHQLQLTLVVVAKKNDNCGWVFEITTNLLNVIGASCKRREMI